MAVRACSTAHRVGERLGRIVTLQHCGFQPSGGFSHLKCADPARRAFSLCPVRLQRRATWPSALIRLTPGENIASTSCSRMACQASCARDAQNRWDRLGTSGGRWHPVNPLQMIRHGDNPFSRPIDRQRRFREPIIPVVNARFCLTAASSPCFLAKSPPIGDAQIFCGPARPYAAVLLTMIKIVLTVAISFASPSP